MDEQQDTRFDTNGDDLIAVANVRRREQTKRQQRDTEPVVIPVQTEPA